MYCTLPKRLPTGYVPCGKCPACTVNRARDWYVRLKEESYHSQAQPIFVTLTYADDYLPPLGVSKVDVQEFHKRLRSRVEFRFFLVAEYGSNTYRPHYHAIYFGFDVDSVRYISEFWRKGFTSISPVNDARLRYVSSYTTSKVYIRPPGKEPPFLLCSRRPGIGQRYLTSGVVRHHRETLSTLVRRGGYSYRMPRYYKDKIFDDDMKECIRDSFDPNPDMVEHLDPFNKNIRYLGAATMEVLDAQKDYEFKILKQLNAKKL